MQAFYFNIPLRAPLQISYKSSQMSVYGQWVTFLFQEKTLFVCPFWGFIRGWWSTLIRVSVDGNVEISVVTTIPYRRTSWHCQLPCVCISMLRIYIHEPRKAVGVCLHRSMQGPYLPKNFRTRAITPDGLTGAHSPLINRFNISHLTVCENINFHTPNASYLHGICMHARVIFPWNYRSFFKIWVRTFVNLHKLYNLTAHYDFSVSNVILICD